MSISQNCREGDEHARILQHEHRCVEEGGQEEAGLVRPRPGQQGAVHPEAEGGEDVDLTQGSDWATVAKLCAVFVVVVLTISWLGWAIVGAFQFVGTARVLGSRRLILDIAIGTALGLLTWYGFYVGLGIPIPAGVLDGVL